MTTTETKSNAADTRHEHQVLTGRVTSAKMEKTIVVEVLRLVQHTKYRRVVRISKNFYAHDEKRQANPGATVRIVASLPHSLLTHLPHHYSLSPTTSTHYTTPA